MDGKKFNSIYGDIHIISNSEFYKVWGEVNNAYRDQERVVKHSEVSVYLNGTYKPSSHLEYNPLLPHNKFHKVSAVYCENNIKFSLWSENGKKKESYPCNRP
jgi:hypothetical protein